MKLSIKKLSLAFGLTWGLTVLSIGWTAAAIGWGDQIVDVINSLYRGFDTTFLGGIIGALWGFIDGVIFGALSAYFYNYLQK